MKQTAATIIFLLFTLFTFGQTRKVTVPLSIDNTGQSDVTVQLHNFIQSVKDSTNIQFRPGTYVTDGTICLVNRHNLTFTGNNTTLFAITDGRNAPISHVPLIAQGDLLDFWPRKRSQFYLRGCTNIRFESLSIRGSNPYKWQQEQSYNAGLEAQHNIDAEGVEGLVILNCDLSHPWGDFIYLGKWNDYNSAPTKNVVVMGTKMSDNGRQGISTVGAENVLIALNSISNTRRATFDIEPDVVGSGSKNIFIKKNAIGQGRLMFVASGGAPTGEVNNIVIDGNTLKDRAMSIAMGGGNPGQRHHVTICNNVGDPTYAYNSPRALVEMVNVDYVTVMNNQNWFAPMQPDDLPGEGNDAVQVLGGKGFYMSGNKFVGAERECDTASCTLSTKPNTLPNERTLLAKWLPSIVVGTSVDGSFEVFSKYKKTYTLLDETGKQVGSGTLKAGYTTLSGKKGYRLKVGTQMFLVS